jgi:hypothetical protein
MSQHLIEESRVLYPEHGQRPEAVPSGRQDDEARGGPGAMRQETYPEGREGRDATVSDISRPRTATGEDASLAALDALTRALAQISEDQRLLETKLQELRRQRERGLEWREILSSEEAPGAMQIVSRMLACLAKASGTLRKELVDTLRREGVSIPAIARMFGVTHQRVSNLLRRPSD